MDLKGQAKECSVNFIGRGEPLRAEKIGTLLRKDWNAFRSCTDSKKLNCIVAEVMERKRQIPDILSMWNPLYLANIWVKRMRETGVKENSKVLRLSVSGMLLSLLTEIEKSKKELFVKRKHRN